MSQATTIVTGFQRTANQVNADLRRFGNEFAGANTIRRGEAMAKAIRDIGGVGKLTDAELKKANATLTEYVAKAERMGYTVPSSVQQTVVALRMLTQEEKAVGAAATAARAEVGKLAQVGSGIGQGLGIGAGIGLAGGIAAGVSELGAAISDVAQRGQQLSALERPFIALSGGAAQARTRLADMQDATRGLVTETQLLQAANKASILGIADLGVDMGELAGLATTLGRAMGQDAAKSVDDATTALGRMSPQIADNLGLSLRLGEANEALAAKLGKSVEALTDQEQKLAFANAFMTAAREKVATLGEVQLTLGDQVQRTAVLYDDLTARVGAYVNTFGPLTGAVDQLVDGLEEVATNGGDFVRLLNDLESKTPPVEAEVGSLEAKLRELRDTITSFSQDQVRNGLAFLLAPAVTGGTALFNGLVGGINDRLREARQTLNAGGPFGLGQEYARTPDLRAPGRTGDIRLSGDGGRAAIARLEQEQESFRNQQRDVQVALEKEHARAIEEKTRKLKAQRDELERLLGIDKIRDAEALAKALAGPSAGEASVATLSTHYTTLATAIDAAKRSTDAYARGTLPTLQAAVQRITDDPRFRQLFAAAAQRTLPVPFAEQDTAALGRAVIGGAIGNSGIASRFGAAYGRTRYGITPGPGVRFNPITGGFSPADDPYNVGNQLAAAAQNRGALAAINVDLTGNLKATRDWAGALQDVSQAFAQLSQVSGGTLDPISSLLGRGAAALSAGQGIAKTFGLSGAAGANVATGVSAATLGFGFGQSLGRTGGTLAGIGAGAAAGLPYAKATGGASIAIGAGIGGVAGYFGARKAESELRKLKDLQSSELVAQYGSLEALLDVVGRVGLSQQDFLRRFYGEPKEFAKAVGDLTTALTKERTEADKLAKSLSSVKDARGTLSIAQIRQITSTRPGGIAQDTILEFVNEQRQAAEGGIVRAVDALLAQASLSSEEIDALTKGIDDQAKREAVIEEALKSKAGQVLKDFGLGVQGAAAGLFAAFNGAIEAGDTAYEALRRLQPQIDGLLKLYERQGRAPDGGLQQLQSYSGIASGPTGAALEVATGLGQALAGFQNSALLSPELFASLANGIGEAYRNIELLGKGGLDAARLMQPALQAIWELAQDDPGLLETLDEQTRALLDFATKSGLVGDKFRPAVDRMIDALDRLIAKFDEYLARLGTAAQTGLPAPPPGAGPGSNGGAGGGGEQTPGYIGGTGGLRDFGRETMVRLHGREAVLTEAQYNALMRAGRGIAVSAVPEIADLPGQRPQSGPIVVQSPIILNNRQVGLAVTEIQPRILQSLGVRA